MNRRSLVAGLGAVIAVPLLPGCASPGGPPPTSQGPWTGRLALRLASEPPQAYTAAFELRGGVEAGALQLSTPLGTVLARMQWEPGRATLTTDSERRAFDSVHDMIRKVTGADWPLTDLFDWLRGAAAGFEGWTVEQDERATGRLRLRRDQPAPAVELRLIVE